MASYLESEGQDSEGNGEANGNPRSYLVELNHDESAALDIAVFDIVNIQEDWIEDKLDEMAVGGEEVGVPGEFDVEGDLELPPSEAVPTKKRKKQDKPDVVDIEQAMKSHDELKEYVDSAKNVNTTRKTRQVMNAFHKWLTKVCDYKQPCETMDARQLDGFMSNYIVQKRKLDGTEHEPDTLTSIHRGILRYLRDKEYQFDPLNDEEFSMSRNVLASKRTKLKQQGKGNRPNKSEGLDDDEIEVLWETGALGLTTPEILQRTLYFFCNLGFGLRGSHEASQMHWGDVELFTTADGTEYIELTERFSKTRQGHAGSEPRAFPPKIFAINTGRCPVWFYHMFKNRRPELMLQDSAKFYLTVHPSAVMSDELGYVCSPMGINKLNEIVRKVCTKAGVPGKKNNHSLRRTGCSTLLGMNVPPVLVAQWSGHKNLASLNNYSTATRKQQKAMSNILTGSRAQASTLPCPAPFLSPVKRKIPSSSAGSALPVEMLSAAPAPASVAVCNESVLPASTAPAPVNHAANIAQLAQTAQGMFSNANFHGQVHLTINYNVSSQIASNVHVSPVIPVKNAQ